MSTENTQQERSYHEFIQNFSSLSEEIKEDGSLPLLFDEKENKSIYNAVVDFNIVKFSIEHPYWDEDENKNKACEVILQECDKIKKAAQKLGDRAKRKLESEVREKLKDYIEGGVKEDGVKIYGNHASITLEDNKKEFKISEFLNSDFCQKNGIFGFSTLHSDGKSGIHGFVAEEGGRKIRHYVVIDGSYEMTLNWYVNGEKCTVTININANGSVERIGGHSVSEEQLQANKDVKIGNLYLYEVLAKGRWKEVNEPSFEAAIKRDVEEPIQENKANNITQETGSQTPPPPPPRTSSLKRNIFGEQEGLDHQDDGQNKFSSNATDIAQKQFIENVLEKIENGSQYDPIRNWLKDKIEGKENNQNLDALEEKLSKKYSQSNTVEKGESDDSKPLSPTSTSRNTDVEQSGDTQPQKNSHRSGQEPEEEERNFQKISKALGEWKENRRNARQSNSSSSPPIRPSHDESQLNPKQLKKSLMNARQSNDTLLTEFTSRLGRETQKFPLRPVDQKEISEQTRERSLEPGLLKDDSTDVKKVEGPTVSVSASTPNNRSDLDMKSMPPSTPSDDSSRTISTSTDNKSIKQLIDKEMLRNIEAFQAHPSSCGRDDSNPSSPTQGSNGQSLVGPKQLKKSLMNAGQSNDTLLMEFTSKLDRETQKFPLRPVDQKEISEQTRERLLADGLLKDNSTDVKKVAERENADTDLTIDKNSNLHRLLEKDVARLEAGVIEEEREDTLVEHTNSRNRNRIALANRNRKLLWTEHIKQQQEKDKGMSI
ncbi:hypothetical protein GO685_02780 [Wolbachia endosymbiont of Madathamugadia hiepei]|uniref:hypothetical protein n=1 Tax=Wolbachia endosymbiont of Madathamugadia hiepei TaxID=1241303 RepID=UPI0015885424|nr:hypothetical protein [Wolbachia endosymbiont of Madathamugadia hiepei]NUX01428.1 hypothetical protein [Wolbachia endosymbiont of Madathamugadia hiepei]